VFGHDDFDDCGLGRCRRRHAGPQRPSEQAAAIEATTPRPPAVEQEWRYWDEARAHTATSGLSAALGTMPHETDVSLRNVGVRLEGPQ
jgi:hypothetical protein